MAFSAIQFSSPNRTKRNLRLLRSLLFIITRWRCKDEFAFQATLLGGIFSAPSNNKWSISEPIKFKFASSLDSSKFSYLNTFCKKISQQSWHMTGPELKVAIRNAMGQWQKTTCLSFAEYADFSGPGIVFKSSSFFCLSHDNIGRSSDNLPQNVAIGSTCPLVRPRLANLHSMHSLFRATWPI